MPTALPVRKAFPNAPKGEQEVRKKIPTYRGRRIRTDENELDEVLPSALYEGTAESPNRVLMPRKIGKRRPEEERGWKPIVI
jgi:hypothetical protein